MKFSKILKKKFQKFKKNSKFQNSKITEFFSAERKDKKEAGDDNDDETERKRRQAGQTPPGGAKSGKNGKKFRPGRVEKKPLRYYQYLAAQIQRKK